ncbi:MAG: prepilin-type N-terminal cleavage/methylation domain-containing protein [Proteobacteria bacterium]|nr:prepilin-type N-terminal cleavage/methylation domain-containing protein [Pseudomonadota bacterium]
MEERTESTEQNLSVARFAAEGGMTLIEIMIVVIIMAMIATGVAVAVLPRLEKARIDSAKSDVAAIRTAVQLYLAENPGKCPSMEDLKDEKYLDKGKRTTDPWEKEFTINCVEGDDPDVFSMGPDMQEGTEDDVR